MENNSNQKTNPKNENVHTYDNGFHPKEIHLKENYRLYHKSFFFLVGKALAVWFFYLVLFIPKLFVWGFKIKGRKNKKYMKGAVIVSNHTYPLDAFFLIMFCWPKRTYLTMLETNLGFGFVSKMFRLGGAVPIPREKNLLKRFYSETKEMLEKKANIIVYPEAALMPFCNHVRNFLPGAFQFAYSANAQVVPCCMTYHKPKGLYKLTRRKKPCMHLNILPPYTIKDMGNKKLTLETAAKEVQAIISDYFNKNSDYFTNNNSD